MGKAECEYIFNHLNSFSPPLHNPVILVAHEQKFVGQNPKVWE